MQVEELRQASLVFRMLSALFREAPRVTGESPAVTAPDPQGDAPEALTQGPALVASAVARMQTDPTAAEEYARDFQRLFIGPDHVPAPPWESVYRTDDHVLCGPPCSEVHDAYRGAGLESSLGSREPEDHIWLELAFCAVLCGRAAESLATGTGPGGGAAAAPWLDHYRAFLRDHLLLWAPAFTKDVLEHAQTDLYRGAGLWLDTWLQQQEAWLREPVAGRGF